MPALYSYLFVIQISGTWSVFCPGKYNKCVMLTEFCKHTVPCKLALQLRNGKTTPPHMQKFCLRKQEQLIAQAPCVKPHCKSIRKLSNSSLNI